MRVDGPPWLGTSKNYTHARFGVPGITYEVGDETPRADIVRSAISLAEAMVEVLYPYADPLDLLIRGGTVVDGSSQPGYVGNVGVHGDRIVYVGREAHAAARVVDATGLIVSPGFIDPHTHTAQDLRSSTTSSNAPYLAQGVTTVFVGNDGDGLSFAEDAEAITAAGPGHQCRPLAAVTMRCVVSLLVLMTVQRQSRNCRRWNAHSH